MSDFTLVDTKGWEYDLQSIYSAYIGYFQLNSIPWYDRSWGHFFTSFDEFLSFSWPVITVTDSWTGRAHIVTRLNSLGAFLKMIKTRFGEILPQAPNILQVSPFESGQRHLRNVSDYSSYKKLHGTLPAAVLAALKARVRAGEPKAVQELWDRKDKTYLALDFEWSERNEKSCLEWGYAAVRCGLLDAMGHWPPVPDSNYRKGHYIVSEYVDKVTNKRCPTYPWQYAFGDSQVLSKTKLPEVIQAIISSLASPDSETSSNNLVIVAHGASGDLQRLEEMKIKLPHNVLIIDTANLERHLFSTGHRPAMLDPKTNKPRLPGTTLSLENLLRSFTIPPLYDSNGAQPTSTAPKPLLTTLPNCTMHNSGNDAFMCLFALQMLLEPEGTVAPTMKKGFVGKPGTSALHMGPTLMGGLTPPAMFSAGSLPITPTFSGFNMTVAPMMMANAGYGMPGDRRSYAENNKPGERRSFGFEAGDLAGEIGKMQISRTGNHSRLGVPSPVRRQSTGYYGP
ncbi:hypothetical protein C8J56DRAFT_914532 [Mycena floridula]|nr:hypothetical protein C8J56DRAFT_914532 [Mycena floridula]